MFTTDMAVHGWMLLLPFIFYRRFTGLKKRRKKEKHEMQRSEEKVHFSSTWFCVWFLLIGQVCSAVEWVDVIPGHTWKAKSWGQAVNTDRQKKKTVCNVNNLLHTCCLWAACLCPLISGGGDGGGGVYVPPSLPTRDQQSWYFTWAALPNHRGTCCASAVRHWHSERTLEFY